MSLVQLIVERGADAVNALPKGIRKSKEAVAETIENNVRKLIIDEHPINPKYYEKMSELLDALIQQRRQRPSITKKYLEEIVELTKKVKNPATGESYPKALNTPAKRALYDNLGKDEALALAVDSAVRASSQDDWREQLLQGQEKSRFAIKDVLKDDEVLTEQVLELVKNQNEY